MNLPAGYATGLLNSLFSPLIKKIQRLFRRAFGGPGLDVHVEFDPRKVWAGAPDWFTLYYFFPDSLPDSFPPSGARTSWKWAMDNGGFEWYETYVRVTLVSDRATTVVIETPTVAATSVSPITGQAVMFPVGGADMEPLAFEATLRSDNGAVHVEYVQDGEATRPQGPLMWSLKSGDAQSIIIHVIARDPGCYQWRASIPIIADGKRKMVDIPGDGELPRVLVGLESGEGKTLRWLDKQWQPLDPSAPADDENKEGEPSALS